MMVAPLLCLLREGIVSQRMRARDFARQKLSATFVCVQGAASLTLGAACLLLLWQVQPLEHLVPPGSEL